MIDDLEIRPVTNPFVMKQFARGNILSDPEEVSRVQWILFNAVADFTRQESDWKQLPAYIDKFLVKERFRTRLYAAGIIPFFQHPVAVVFKITGEYCLLFELVGLKNGRPRLDLPIESNMNHGFFMDLLTGAISKNQDMGNNALPYDLLVRLFKIDGLRNYGVTLRQHPELMGDDLLVISENPFGVEFRMPLKPFRDRDIKCNVTCVIDRETKKEVKTIPDVFFVWEVLQDIATAWPEDKSAAELVDLVEKALAVLNVRAITKRHWCVDRRINRDYMPIGWIVEDTGWESRKQPGAVSLPLVGEKDDVIRFVVAYKGLSEAAAKSIETVYKKESLSGSLKNIFSLKRKTDGVCEAESLKAVTFKKAPREVSRAILKAIQGHLSISCSELKYTIQVEMKRMKLEQTIAVDRICIDIEKQGPAVYVPDISSDLIYKFVIERRTDENTESYGVIQVDAEGDEIRRFSISKSRIML
jgi:hypothetical protein